MTPFWLWVSAGCAACGVAGFSTARYGTRMLLTGRREAPMRLTRAPQAPVVAASAAPPLTRPVVQPPLAEDEVVWLPVSPPPPPVAAPPRRASATRRRVAPAPAAPVPAPTAERPAAEKLALWTRQVKAGERKMSIATDGCRVTWNRTCKHGHPSWLVYLGYLKRRPTPKRHNPR